MFSRGSNPAIDCPNQRKSMSYASEEVEHGRADWVDRNDRAKGIICRAFLYSGQQVHRLESADAGSSPMPRLKWLPPQDERWKQIQATSKIVNVRRFALSA